MNWHKFEDVSPIAGGWPYIYVTNWGSVWIENIVSQTCPNFVKFHPKWGWAPVRFPGVPIYPFSSESKKFIECLENIESLLSQLKIHAKACIDPILNQENST